MIFKLWWVSITPDMLSRPEAPVWELPAQVIPRPANGAGLENRTVFAVAESAKVGDFWVPQGPLVSAPVRFARTRLGDAVRVPMWAYRTAKRNRSCILATGMELAARAVEALVAQTGRLPSEMTCVVGDDCVPLTDDAYRCFVNFALRLD